MIRSMQSIWNLQNKISGGDLTKSKALKKASYHTEHHNKLSLYGHAYKNANSHDMMNGQTGFIFYQRCMHQFQNVIAPMETGEEAKQENSTRGMPRFSRTEEMKLVAVAPLYNECGENQKTSLNIRMDEVWESWTLSRNCPEDWPCPWLPHPARKHSRGVICL